MKLEFQICFLVSYPLCYFGGRYYFFYDFYAVLYVRTIAIMVMILCVCGKDNKLYVIGLRLRVCEILTFLECREDIQIKPEPHRLTADAA